MKTPSGNQKLNRWVEECAALCEPETIHWCDGSASEYDRLMGEMVASGMAIPIKQRPNSFLFRSDPSDVARVEDRTYISYPTQAEAGPTNNWVDPGELKKTMTRPLQGLHARPHHVRDPLLHGAHRFADRQDRRRDHGQPLRGLQHAHHDPRRHEGARDARPGRRVHPLPALHRRAARPRGRRTHSGRAPRSSRSTSATSRRKT